MKAQSVRTARGKLRKAVSSLMTRSAEEGHFNGWRSMQPDENGDLFRESVKLSEVTSAQLDAVAQATAAFAAAVRREERER